MSRIHRIKTWIMYTENDITYAIRGAAFDTFKELGPGMFESVYEAALEHLLKEKGFT